MPPSDLLGDLPGNLSRQAVDDLVRILRRSVREFGIGVARQSRERLLARARAVEDGTAIGHPRHDVHPRRPTLFLNEAPWVICFNPHTRQIYRILHGARDFPAIFGGPPSRANDDTA
jgi:plasmid stabilization system protein ParE